MILFILRRRKEFETLTSNRDNSGIYFLTVRARDRLGSRVFSKTNNFGESGNNLNNLKMYELKLRILKAQN